VAGEDEGGEEVIADGAGGFFYGFAGAGDAVGDAGLMEVEGDVVAGAEVMDELLVGVGFSSSQAVMNVDGGEADAQSVAFCVICGVESEEESDGVGSAGDGCAEAVAGADVVAREGKRGNGGHA
jgi:hypothetical protein